jgi:GT2 family glycosyltransferase
MGPSVSFWQHVCHDFSGDEMTPIGVAIVNYNTREHLHACLATVLVEAPSEVVVVDNASSDGSVEMVQADYPGVLLLANKTNPGYGTAANQAIARCTAKYVLLLNADTLLQPGTLQAMSAYLDLHPRAAIVGPRLVNPDGTLQASCYAFSTPLNTLLEYSTLGRLIRYLPVLRNKYLGTWPHTHARVVAWVKGAALAIRREAFEAVSGFDESFFMYFEEADLCYRLNAAGWQAHFAPVTTVQHVGGASTKHVRTEMAVQLFVSTMQFFQRHYSGIRLTKLVVTMKSIMLARLTIDTVRLHITHDARKRAKIAEDVATWKRALLGHWQRQVPRG